MAQQPSYSPSCKAASMSAQSTRRAQSSATTMAPSVTRKRSGRAPDRENTDVGLPSDCPFENFVLVGEPALTCR